MPRVAYVYDPLYLEHELPGHPERPERLRAIMSHLQDAGYIGNESPSPAHGRGARGEGPQLTRVEARDATTHELRFVHTESLIEEVAATSGVDRQRFDADTYGSARSYEAALRAAGGTLAATEAVLRGEVDSAFCFVRPPGHHATPDRAMGFCLFNNVAVAAARALEEPGIDRVAIIDIDVHHGNGTQDIFYDDPCVLYFSTHQFPHYPGTGHWTETGSGDGDGTTINVPLPQGAGDDIYRRCYTEICAPAVRRFRPQLIFVSAGFDAHFADPLAAILLSTRGYFEIASLIRELAAELCEGRLVYALEGGYDLTAIAWSARACLDTLLGNLFAEDPLGLAPAVPGPNIAPLLSEIKRLHNL
jgi:acetoin utilization deacetylase AcuC-like enzyme